MTHSAYFELEQRFKRLNDIKGAMAMLHWDSAAVMPVGGAAARAEQLAALESIAHGIVTHPSMEGYLEEARAARDELDPWQQSNLALMYRGWKHANAVEDDLVVALSRAGSECEMVWRTARKQDDFAIYAPYQQKVLELVREVAQCKAEALGCSPYDALLDQYDAGRTSKEIDQVFGDLEGFLPDFIQHVLEYQSKKGEPTALTPPFPVEKQEMLARRFMTALSFDFDRGRLDTSLHPFCGGVPGDTRITTRYDEADFTSGLMGILHETGHALYEMGLPERWSSQPVGDALGMTIHESQSLLVEMQVCRSSEFLRYATPIIVEAFGVSGAEWSVENIQALYQQVSPGFIRVDADEVTYPVHVMLRYKLEQSLISGALNIADVPELWRAEMKCLLNVDVPNDRDGCMQDIHWTDGSFGYFPTYTLGAMAAAQFFHTAKKDCSDIVPGIEQGDFAPLVSWLRKHIHSKGSYLPANELLKEVTGEYLNPEIYKKHLNNRYLK